MTFKNIKFLPGAIVDFGNATILGLENRKSVINNNKSDTQEIVGQAEEYDSLPHIVVSFAIESEVRLHPP
jgi:hypothetical protein